MKNLTIYTAIACFFALVLMPATQVQAQMVEGDYTHTDPYDTDTFPKQLEESLLPSIMVSPNPATSNQIQIWYNKLKESSKLIIYDAAGRQHYATKIEANNQQKGVYTLAATRLSPGMYFVKLQSGIYESVAKFIIR